MKKLLLALVAISTLYLTACSSCLGTTPTPGEAAPQAEAPKDTRSMVAVLDSLLKAGDGAQFYGVLANVPEKMMDETDTAKVQMYVMQLQEFITENQQQIDALIQNTSDPVAKTELPGLVTFFSDIDKLRSVFGFGQPADDMASVHVEQ